MATFTAYWSSYRDGSRVEDQAVLFDAETGTSDGEWIDMAGVEEASYEVKGITTGTVNWYGSNAYTAPAVDDDTEDQYGIATNTSTLVKSMTADGKFTIPYYLMPRWVRMNISAASSISLTVNLKRVKHSS